jgi:hypothetical protein
VEKKKVLIIAGSIILIIIIFLLINRGDRFQNKLINYITKKDYIVDVGSLYKYKGNNLNNCGYESVNDCEGQAYFFDSVTYSYYMNKNVRKNGVLFEFTPLYNYKNDEITYTLRITYQNGVLMYEGIYSKDKFTCEEEYVNGIDIEKTKMCKYAKNEANSFSTDARLFMSDSYLLNKIKEK